MGSTAGAQSSNGTPEDAPSTPPAPQAPAAIPQNETDDRKKYQWKSGYPNEARVEIRCETAYVIFVLLFALGGLLLTWRGLTTELLSCPTCSNEALKKYAYFFFSGVLGGALFGIKFLYHVVARGFWHQDRRLWRVLSPLLAGSLAFVIGALVDAGLLGLTIKTQTGATYVSLGFITGYFGDKALQKMTEIANVIFGTSDSGPKKASDGTQASNPGGGQNT